MSASYRTVFQCFYALAKYILDVSKKKNLSLSLRLWVYFVAIATLVFAVSVRTSCAVAYVILDYFLRVRHKERFAGLVSSGDIIYEVEKKKCIINATFLLKPKDENYDILKLGHEFTKRFHESSRKLSYTIHQVLGYNYFLKNDVKYEDFLTISNHEGELSRDVLQDILEQEFLDCGFLQNKMYRVTLFQQPVQWNLDKKYHVIHLTLRHSFCDAIAFFSILKHGVFDQFEILPIFQNGNKNVPAENLDDVYVTRNPFKTFDMTGMLEAKNGSSMKFSWFIEEEVKYLHVIKEIRRKLKVGFTDLIHGAFMTAILDYAKQENKPLTKFRTAVMSKPVNSTTMEMLSGNYDFNDIVNDSIFVFMDDTHKLRSSKLMNTVMGFHNLSQDIGKSFDAKLTYLIQRSIYSLIPSYIHLLIRDWIIGSPTILLSNATGVQSGKIDDHDLAGIIPFTTGCFSVGFFMAVMTFGGRLHVTVTTREGMVANRQELNNILADTFKNIDLLAEEVKLVDSQNGNSYN